MWILKPCFLLGECKSRAGGFKLLYDAKEQDNSVKVFENPWIVLHDEQVINPLRR